VSIDFAAFNPGRHDPDMLLRARRVWETRIHSEYKSLQIMARFLSELTGAGEALTWHAGAVDLITDEAAHVRLCWDLCQALGGTPSLPHPPQLDDPKEFLEAPMVQRALATALTMLVVNETISVAWLRDLAARCQDPVVGAVLQATVADEEAHDTYGLDYARQALARFDARTRPAWQGLVQRALNPHQRWAERVPDAPDDPDEQAQVDLGLFSPQRQARVLRQTWRDVLGPRLVDLGLI
jgi:hypothetical protein